MKKLFLIPSLVFVQYFCFAQPVINSFTPQSAAPLSQVTITGSGFSNTASNNIVFFGVARAIVNAASVNQLTVTVPAGASYARLSITTDKLTAFSQLAFNPVTGYGTYNFDPASFDAPLPLFNTGSQAKFTVHVNDFNSDGKPDIIGGDSISTNISIIGNTSYASGYLNNNSFVYNSPINVNAYENYACQVSDFNGDGKSDLAIGGYATPSSVRVFTNQSSANSISLSSPAIINTSGSIPALATGDIDNDGKIDLVTFISSLAGSLQILKNTTPLNGNISFDTLTRIACPDPSLVQGIAVADIDGDGKQDIVYGNWFNNSLYVLLNASTGSNISFNNPIAFTVASYPRKVIVTDIDNDGSVDIICCSESGILSIFRNTSTAGNLLLSPRVELPTGNRTIDMCVGDFDGDGKPDIACSVNVNYSANSYIALFKNNSTAGNLDFTARVEIKVTNAYGIACGDIDKDGMQDIVAGCNYTDGKLGVLRNRITTTVPFQLCPPAGSGVLQSNFTGTFYQWELSTDSVNFSAITDNSNFSGSGSGVLQLNNINSSWYGYQFRCVLNQGYNRIFTLTFKNIWTGAVDSTWENPANWSCNTLPDGNTDVLITGGTVVLGSDVSCRSIKVSPSAFFTVLPGFTLTVTH